MIANSDLLAGSSYPTTASADESYSLPTLNEEEEKTGKNISSTNNNNNNSIALSENNHHESKSNLEAVASGPLKSTLDGISSSSTNSSSSRGYRERYRNAATSVNEAGVLQHSGSNESLVKKRQISSKRYTNKTTSTTLGRTVSSATTTASSSSNSQSLGFSDILRKRSIGIRESLARGRSSLVSKYSSTSYHKNYPKNDFVASGSNHSSSSVSRMFPKKAYQNRRPKYAAGVYRGYKLDDYALVELGETIQEESRGSFTKGDLSEAFSEHEQNHWRGHLVNQHGFPEGKGSRPSEKRGPYIYLMCKIQQVHYEENEVFWTVERLDTGTSMRGEALCMQPIQTEQGFFAAQAASDLRANWFSREHGLDGEKDPLEERTHDGENTENWWLVCIANCFCITFCLPWFCLYECCLMIKNSRAYALLLKKATMFLNGVSPYMISFRITTVNLIVVCSIWYLFIDLIRLTFLPPEADETLAYINLVVWWIMLFELIVEVFIRPDSWKQLVRSDQAMSPQTARYISSFHLIIEFISLIFFAPVFFCLWSTTETCSGRPTFSYLEATISAVVGPTILRSLYGRIYYGVVRFRIFALVRHWRNAWLNHTFINERKLRRLQKLRLKRPRYIGDDNSIQTLDTLHDDEIEEDDDPSIHTLAYGGNQLSDHQLAAIHEAQEERERERKRAKASNIGTALMIVNSHRALFMLCFLTACFPILFLVNESKVVNDAYYEMVDFLQQVNVQSSLNENTTFGCDYLLDSVGSWSKTMVPRFETSGDADQHKILLSLSITPGRCAEQFNQTSIGGMRFQVGNDCPSWAWSGSDKSSLGCIYGNVVPENLRKRFKEVSSLDDLADSVNVRVGSIVTYSDSFGDEVYGVSASYNLSQTIRVGARYSFILQVLLLLFTIGSLQILRNDTVNLVLGSLRSMLRIVSRYAKNPLAQNPLDSPMEGESGSVASVGDDEEDQLVGTYETEQLVTAVSKITDLLRKCWGVAGADIISTNLASRKGSFEVFNPTVPGRNVFALFAFAKIKDFDHALKCLEGDVMILINDVADVLHGDVYRWALGDSGQCNKNLGAAFFIVFKIGLVKEVIAKLEEATRVVFSTANAKKASTKKRSTIASHAVHDARKNRRRKYKALITEEDPNAKTAAMYMSLKQIPGISAFADRAVIAMLKAFAGIHRDTTLRAWTRDFRLNKGGGKVSVDMIFGMDAGWAVEGAVGSEYKIDATYLSPHVNMAARMMSACNHYGVTILLSEAVQELLSDQGKQKMRNIDRVTVKGSSQVQNIYTYDARSEGADFFLYSVSDEQADHQAMSYEPNIWHEDPDLKAMRHHITEDFEVEFEKGMKSYYSGDWPTAIEMLKKANDIMIETAMDEGYLEEDEDCNSTDRNELYQREAADQPCRYLINFMKSRGGQAPEEWDGWHPLLSK